MELDESEKENVRNAARWIALASLKISERTRVPLKSVLTEIMLILPEMIVEVTTQLVSALEKKPGDARKG